jgi:hypothetical protein
LLGDDFFREAVVVDLGKTQASDAEITRISILLPQAAITCPPSYASRHGERNIWPTTTHHYDPVSLAVSIGCLAFTGWIACLCYARFRRDRTSNEALLPPGDG